MSASPQVLLKKLQALPPQRRAEVEDFIDFLSGRDAGFRKTLTAVWDNPADADYDEPSGAEDRIGVGTE